MDLALPPILRVPARVGGDPELVSATALRPGGADGPPTLLVAGPPPGRDEGVVILARRGARTATLLSLPDHTLPRAVDLVPFGDGSALALVPGHGLFRLDPDAPEGRPTARRLVPSKALPDRLARMGEAVVAARAAPDGRTGWTRLRATGVAEGHSRSAGPRLTPGQPLGALLADAAGRPVAVADDEALGLAAWVRSADGGWLPLVERGAGRFAFNAAARDACLWQGRVAVAAGPTERVRARLSGMPMSGEILLVGGDLPLALLAGELRTSAAGLIVPEVGARGMAALGPGVPVRLLALGGLLVVAIERDDGRTAIRGITPARGVIDLGEAEGTALPVALDDGLALVLPEG